MKKLSCRVFLPLLAFAAVIVSVFAGCGTKDASLYDSILSGYGAKDKVFSVQGMNITLTDSFAEQEYITQTAAYVSQDEMVAVTKESFSDIGSSTYSNKSYMQLVARNNNLNSVTIEENETYAYFTYKKTVSGKVFYYFATGRKGPTAYWLIQFGCLEGEADKHQANFEKYAASVTFDGVNSDVTV